MTPRSGGGERGPRWDRPRKHAAQLKRFCMTTPLQDSLQDQLIRHIPDLRRFARSLERDRAAADDLVQETLERAIRKLHLYQPCGPFLGWLNTIMRNRFVDRVRRGRTNHVASLDQTPWTHPRQ